MNEIQIKLITPCDFERSSSISWSTGEISFNFTVDVKLTSIKKKSSRLILIIIPQLNSQWTTDLLAIWPVKMRKNLQDFFNNFVWLPRKNVDSGMTKSADKKRAEGVISKEMLVTHYHLFWVIALELGRPVLFALSWRVKPDSAKLSSQAGLAQLSIAIVTKIVKW